MEDRHANKALHPTGEFGLFAAGSSLDAGGGCRMFVGQCDTFDMVSFTLGTDAGDHLIVEIDGRPDEHDDWVSATISVQAGAFTASIDATLVTCDFPRFRRQLELLHKALTGSATFDTIERQLRIECVGNDRGGIAITGAVQDRVGDGNELRFRFDIDQTFLPNVISELLAIESEFSNRVHPPFPQ